MRLNKPALIDRKKATAFMDEKAEMQEEREKGLIATVHEIRNPLTAIKLTNQLMQEAFEKAERDPFLMQSYMTIIANNIDRIENHIREVLGDRKKEILPEPVNISDCIDKALCEARDRIYLSNVTVSNNYNGSHWVYGNKEKLMTAFLNIIINAVEAIKTPSGRIWISVYEMNSIIRITFKDNGGGMDSATVGKIFDPHFSTKDGIGIGLYNVKEILKQHKANIVADSLPGIGTSISILFSSIPVQETQARSKRASGPVSDNH